MWCGSPPPPAKKIIEKKNSLTERKEVLQTGQIWDNLKSKINKFYNRLRHYKIKIYDSKLTTKKNTHTQE